MYHVQYYMLVNMMCDTWYQVVVVVIMEMLYEQEIHHRMIVEMEILEILKLLEGCEGVMMGLACMVSYMQVVNGCQDALGVKGCLGKGKVYT